MDREELSNSLQRIDKIEENIETLTTNLVDKTRVAEETKNEISNLLCELDSEVSVLVSIIERLSMRW